MLWKMVNGLNVPERQYDTLYFNLFKNCDNAMLKLPFSRFWGRVLIFLLPLKRLQGEATTLHKPALLTINKLKIPPRHLLH